MWGKLISNLMGSKEKNNALAAEIERKKQQMKMHMADKADAVHGIVSPLPMTPNPYVKQAPPIKVMAQAPPVIPSRPVTPTPTPLPIRIAIPASSGKGETIVPEPAASALMQAFDPYGEATRAAQVMHHPMQISGTPNEIKAGYNNFGNMGENGTFNPKAENRWNSNGTVDLGLMQTNSGTFAGMQANPFWKQAMEKRGITSFSQMTDPYKNAMMNMLILMRGNFDPKTGSMKKGPRNYKQWFAAPAAQRWD